MGADPSLKGGGRQPARQVVPGYGLPRALAGQVNEVGRDDQPRGADPVNAVASRNEVKGRIYMGARLTAPRPKGRSLLLRVRPGRAAVLYTGFSALRGSEEYLHAWPYLDRGAADYLADIGVAAVVTEGMSVAGWPGAKGFPWSPLVSEEDVAYVHLRLLRAGVIIVEGACDLGELVSCEEPLLVIAPLKVRGAEAAMARVLALC